MEVTGKRTAGCLSESRAPRCPTEGSHPEGVVGLANVYRLQDISISVPHLLLLITRGTIVECCASSSRPYRCGRGSRGSPASVPDITAPVTDAINVGTIDVAAIDVGTVNVATIDVGTA